MTSSQVITYFLPTWEVSIQIFLCQAELIYVLILMDNGPPMALDSFFKKIVNRQVFEGV